MISKEWLFFLSGVFWLWEMKKCESWLSLVKALFGWGGCFTIWVYYFFYLG